MTDITVRFPKAFKPLDDPYRYKVMWGGRGSAKSWSVARKLLLRGMVKPIRVLCTRELQKSIKQSVHKLLCLQIEEMEIAKFYPKASESSVIKGVNGTEFMFLGTKHNPEEIKSTEAIDICWIEEAQNLTVSSWDLIDPTIRKEGSEIWCTYNTRFKFDTVHNQFVVNTPPPNSWVQRVNYDQNPYFPEVLRNLMEHTKETDYEKYLHIWEGELKAVAEGAIFGNQITKSKKEGRHLFIPVLPNKEVMVFYDIGKNDATAMWFVQHVGMEIRLIDFYSNRLQDVDHYVRHLKSLGYNYGEHYMPHDADHDRLGMVRNIREQFEDGGIEPITIVERIQHKATAIELAREVFPQCWFHQADDERGERMEKGIDALSNYRYKYKDDDDVFNLNPHHDWASNPADAFMQMAQGYEGTMGNYEQAPHVVRAIGTG